jgi:LuxR family transcriptional regulator
VTAVGLRRPGMGVLLLTGTEQLRLTAEAWTLLRTWAELWLGRGSQWGGPASGPQVDASTSSVVFTDRQLEVLGLLANGLTNSEIGKELSISASLAKQEVAFLSHALQAKNRLDTVVQAQRQGILPVGRG